MENSKDKGFIQIPNWYFKCGLTLLQVNTLAEIASWQREDKQFFQSMEGLACKYNISYSQMRRCFKDLLELGLIKQDGKVKRMWKYTVDSNRLNQFYIDNKPKTEEEDSVHHEHNSDRLCSPRTQIVSTMNNYNTNNTSLNKTSVRGNETILDRSSPTREELQIFAAQLNLDK